MSRRTAALLAITALCCAACGSSSPRSAQPTARKTSPQGIKKAAKPGRSQHASAHHTAVAAAAHPIVGIGDNNTVFFGDPRFRALGISHARDDVPWDVLSNRFARARLAAWLAAAQRLHVTPLITFDRSGTPGRQRVLPSVAAYSEAFLAFRKLFPWVTEFVTWDESNYYGEPTATDPARVAAYYLALRRDCPQCTILATDLLDISNPRYAVGEVKWARELISDLHTQPPYWGLNNYVGANELSMTSTKQLLAAVSGEIWFVETGGVVSFGAQPTVATPAVLEHQASVDRFILERLASLSPRIKRVYLYEWAVLSPKQRWDSALIAYGGAPRPAYYALADVLDSWGVQPDCAISRAPPSCAHP